MDQRDTYLHLVKVLDQTDRYQETIDAMKYVIKLNPELNTEEQQLLSSSYKNAIEKSRNALRQLTEIIASTDDEQKKQGLLEIQQKMFHELETYCNDLINLIETQLLPVAKDSASKIFFEQLEADYLRYNCESNETTERKELEQKADEHYRRALEISSGNLPSYSPIALGLILNYSVFLFEVVGEKEKALKLAQDTYNDSSQTYTQNSPEQSVHEAELILGYLDDNIKLWTSHMNKEE